MLIGVSMTGNYVYLRQFKTIIVFHTVTKYSSKLNAKIIY